MMVNGDTGAIAFPVYAELQPRDRHRSLVDHLFVLRDIGRLANVGDHVFASPFAEIALVGRCQAPEEACNPDALTWKAVHLPPRFGRRVRRRQFHGWMLGVRCRPLALDAQDLVFADLSELFAASVISEPTLDPVIGAIDDWIDHLAPRLRTAGRRHGRISEGAEAFESVFASAQLPSTARVADVATAAGMIPRTLQRHCRRHTGLAPKRYAAVRRFNLALRQVAQSEDSLAQIAADAGYSDQAHLTMDVRLHTGLSPGRFRKMAQRRMDDAVRFFKDAALRKRVRLLVCEDDEAKDHEFHAEGPEF